MYDMMRWSEPAGAIYMVGFFVLANFILMEMFVAVILENFQLRYEEKIALQTALLKRKIRAERNAKMLKERLDKEAKKAAAAQQEKQEALSEAQREAEIRAKRMELEAEKKDPELRKKKEAERQKKLDEEKAALEEKLKEEEAERLAKEEAEAYGEMGGDNILLQDFDANAGQLEEDQPKKKKKKLKDGEVDEEDSEFVVKSCFVFNDENRIRMLCSKINSHPAFEWTIFVIIITGSVIQFNNIYILPSHCM